MGLEALAESYGFWRPSLRTLTFEDIPGMKQVFLLDYTCSRPTHPLHRYGNPPSPFPLPASRGPSAYDSKVFCSLSLPPSQIGYLQTPPHGYGSIHLHSPHYGLYSYAASPDKMAASGAPVANQNPFLGSSPSGTLTESLGMLSGGQQANFLFDSRTLGFAGSQSGGGPSQVTAHMG
ncbi:unnamed protein product, partial [Coregonus sp. 'balchen']